MADHRRRDRRRPCVGPARSRRRFPAQGFAREPGTSRCPASATAPQQLKKTDRPRSGTTRRPPAPTDPSPGRSMNHVWSWWDVVGARPGCLSAAATGRERRHPSPIPPSWTTCGQGGSKLQRGVRSRVSGRVDSELAVAAGGQEPAPPSAPSPLMAALIQAVAAAWTRTDG